MMKRALNFISSLKLTVICLVLALVVTFVGTLAQVKMGLWVAQEEFFRSLFVWWGPEGAGWKIPVLPGGWLLGGVLLVNLLAAHAKRFKFTRQKAGIFMIHFGLILLLCGQFLTEVFQVESVMFFAEGQSKNYSESQLKNELVLIDASDPATDHVTAIPDELLAKGKEISDARLPFTVKVHEFWVNSEPVMGGATADGRLTAPDGAGKLLQLTEKPFTAKMDDRNIAAAKVEVLAGGKSLGNWLVSPWMYDPMLSGLVQRQFGPQFAAIRAPQQFTHEGKTWEVALRYTRYYKPFDITLLQADHDIYQGTDIPKNFSSNVRIENPQTGEKREARIYMNNPLRYAGETYFQFQMGADEAGRPGSTSTLQVVRNPAWITPYLSCTIMSLGLVVQFMMHLVAFGKRISKQNSTPGANDRGESQSKKSPKRKPTAKAKEAEVVAARTKAQA